MLRLSASRSLRFDDPSRAVEVVVVIQSVGIQRLLRWGLGALVLLLAHGLFVPGARAGCNHGVTSQSDRRLDFNRLDDLIAGDAGRHAPAVPPCRCSGPGCSSDTPGPAPTGSPAPTGPDQWIAVMPAPGPDASSPPRLIPDEPAARPAGHRPSIFHPPPA